MSVIDQAKSESRHRVKEILISLGGISPDLLDGKGHGCPKCGDGGKPNPDRFNWIEKNQAVFCRKCFHSGHPDIVSSIKWILDLKDDITAAFRILEFLGVQPEGNRVVKLNGSKPKANGKPKSKSKEKQEKKNPWDSFGNVKELKLDSAMGYLQQAGIYSKNKLTSVEAMVAVGARHASHHLHGTGWLWPQWNNRDGKWVITGIAFSAFSVSDANRKIRTADGKGVSTISVSGSEAGIVGPVDRLESSHTVVVCEGVSDMLAMQSRCPEGWVAISPSNGASQTPPSWLECFFKDKTVFLVPDIDAAGEAMVKKWESVLGETKLASVVKLPLPPLPSDPEQARLFKKDLCDFLRADGADEKVFWSIFDLESDHVTKLEVESQSASYAKLIANIDLEVLYQDESGRIVVYSKDAQKNWVIRDINRISEQDLILATRKAAAPGVIKQPGTKDPGNTIFEFRSAIAYIACHRSETNIDMVGRGVWLAKDGALVACNGRSLSIWDGKKLRKELAPRYENLSFEYSHDWFDHGLLEIQMSQTDLHADWIFELEEVLDCWTWTRDVSPRIAAGMILASICQGALPWRPMVSLTGKTASGKTMLVNSIVSLLPGRTHLAGNYTAAAIGIRCQHHSDLMFLDEWDQCRQKKQILELIRACTRPGGYVERANSHQRLLPRRMNAITWAIGISDGIEDEADRNRAVELSLGSYSPGGEKDERFRKLLARIENSEYMSSLGHRLLAVAMANYAKAMEFYEAAKLVRVDGVNQRVLENYALPAAFLSAAIGGTEATACDLAVSFLDSTTEEREDMIADEERVIGEILECYVDFGRGQRERVGSVMNSILNYEGSSDPDRFPAKLSGILEDRGVKIDQDQGVVYFAQGRFAKDLQTTSRSISQILKRISFNPRSGKGQNRCYMSGVRCRAIGVPLDYITNNFIRDGKTT